MITLRKAVLIIVLIVIILLGAIAWYLGLFDGDFFDENNEITLIPEEETEQVEENEATPKVQEVKYELEIVAEGLFVPWSIVFTSPDRMLVSERSGQIQQIENGVLQTRPVKDFVEVSSAGESGLMGLALHPNYSENKYVYASLAYPRGDDLFVKVVRMIDEGDVLSSAEILIDNIPAAQFHAGSEISFGPDGYLYITTGDATEGALAQSKDSLAGKILRINDDGTVPAGNPFPGSPIWTLGHRNSQGIDWHPDTREMYSTEHGPSGFDGPGGGDEINRIVQGENYGWPEISHQERDPRFASPLMTFTPAIAPASGEFYTGDRFPSWRGDLFVGMLQGEGIMRAEISENSPSQLVRVEKLEDVNVGRVREIQVGPDGYIYFATSNTDGRGTERSGDDKIYRIVPESEL